MLGTNDTKSYFHRTPYEIANGMGKLVGQVLTSAGVVGAPYPVPKVLVVSALAQIASLAGLDVHEGSSCLSASVITPVDWQRNAGDEGSGR